MGLLLTYPEDKQTIERIKKAHPKVRTELYTIYREIEDVALTGNSGVRFTSILRTFPEQDAIYALGRTIRNPDGYNKIKKPMGNIVTNAKAGQSIHNYGLAPDIALLIDKDKNGTFESIVWDMKADLDGDNLSDWMEIANVFRKYGWAWGGDWNGSFKDYPHFDKDFGLGWRGLLELHNQGKVDAEGYVIID